MGFCVEKGWVRRFGVFFGDIWLGRYCFMNFFFEQESNKQPLGYKKRVLYDF
jgi:hypothetical protein